MRAITVSEFGPPSVLEHHGDREPRPGAGAGARRGDRGGHRPVGRQDAPGPLGPQAFPTSRVPRCRASCNGSAPESSACSAGDFVIGSPGFTGGYADYSSSPPHKLAAIPGGLDVEADGRRADRRHTAIEGSTTTCSSPRARRSSSRARRAAWAPSWCRSPRRAGHGCRDRRARPTTSSWALGADEVLDYHGDWVTPRTGSTPPSTAWAARRGRAVSRLCATAAARCRSPSSSPSTSARAWRSSGFAADVTTERLAEGSASSPRARSGSRSPPRLPLDDALRVPTSSSRPATPAARSCSSPDSGSVAPPPASIRGHGLSRDDRPPPARERHRRRHHRGAHRPTGAR